MPRAGDSPASAPLGVVIPTLDEATHLPHLLEDLRRLSFPVRIVVADGGSSDGTREVAEAAGARVVTSEPGRARQMNAGAAALDTRWLLFLHADARLPAEGRSALAWRLAQDPGGDHVEPEGAAHFDFRLDGDGWFWRLLEWGQGLRERYTGLVYGDQGLLVSRRSFRAVGGFPDLPIMEDVEIVRRLRRRTPVERLPAPLPTSPRRYEREGRWRGFLRNALLIVLHGLRVPPSLLARAYPPLTASSGGSSGTRSGSRPGFGSPPRSDGPAGSPSGVGFSSTGGSGNPPEMGAPSGLGSSSAGGSATPAAEGVEARDLLIVFAKAPVPGRVKTRLAAGIGADAAADVYREIGRGVVERVCVGGHRTLVLFDPPDALETMRAWLGVDGIDYRAQRGRDLGERLTAAFEEGLRRADRVVVVGTDIPGLTLRRVEEAFAALREGADLVVGPANDGGYYLLGLVRPAPELFRQMRWSTETVLAETRKRAARLGLQEVMLPPLSDVDTVADLDATRHLPEAIRGR